MALKKCKECGHEVITKAASCLNCGAVPKQKTVCFKYIGVIFLILVILVVIISLTGGDETSNAASGSSSTSVSSKSKPKADQKVYKEAETVHVGYNSYAVWQSWWSSSLSSNQFLDQRPNAMYLFVRLTVRNDDKKPRMVPPFKLLDENGAEYEASSNAWAVEGSIGILENLNPSVSKQGFVVFDVPKAHKYRLKLSGGYWSAKDAYVQLNPKDSR